MTSESPAERPRSNPRRPALSGDEAELFRRYQTTVYRVTRRRIGGCPDALIEDACAIAWMQLCLTQPGRRNVVGWLVTVARHAALHLLKESAPTEDLEHAERVVGGSVEDDAELARETRAMLEAVARLKPAQRRTLALKAAGFKYREIQELCGGKTYTWVNRHITEGRAALRAVDGLDGAFPAQHGDEEGHAHG